jgi:acetyl esterase/lipase
VIGTNDVYDSSARALTNAAQAVLISVEYRKAPENRFPTAHEDAYAAYLWALEHAGEINGDPARVAVAGESAGGNLAAGVAMMAKERGQKLPVHQLLIYPVAGNDFTTPSYQENAQAAPLNKAMMPWFFEKYLMSPADAKSPLIALVNAQGSQRPSAGYGHYGGNRSVTLRGAAIRGTIERSRRAGHVSELRRCHARIFRDGSRGGQSEAGGDIRRLGVAPELQQQFGFGPPGKTMNIHPGAAPVGSSA